MVFREKQDQHYGRPGSQVRRFKARRFMQSYFCSAADYNDDRGITAAPTRHKKHMQIHMQCLCAFLQFTCFPEEQCGPT